ncbi:TPA: restriction endonuclease subunit S [Photobacterium damselae]
MSVIEQIVPDGYKRTEVGVIPENWEVSSFDNISSLIGDGIHTTPNYDENGDFYFVNGNNLVNGSISLDSNTKRTNLTEYKKHKKPLDKRTLLLSINGTIGNIAEYNNESIVLGKSAAFINIKKGVEKKYIFYVLDSHRTKLSFFDGLTGSTIKNLGLGTIRATLLPLPTEKEQAAIANALSDVDALLTELEKLIAKKQAIKTATMQQLLTGKTRLPQFAIYTEGEKQGQPKGTKSSELGEIPEDWDVRAFIEVMSIRHGKDQKSVQVVDGLYPIFGTGGKMGTTNIPLYDKPSVLIGRKGTINKPRYADTPFWTVDTLFYSEISPKADPKFLFYKFCMIDWMQYNEASGVPSLNASTIESVTATFPKKEEQTAIASTLSDMDNEIQTLEQRLAKTRQIKQGMMQELLTGRTRLPFKKES